MSGFPKIDNDDWYPERPAVLAQGQYEAWLAATDRNGYSAVSWRIKEVDGDMVQASDTHASRWGSGEERAYLGGVAAILEALASSSGVTIHCLAEHVVKGINEWLPIWADREWRKVADKEIWQRIYKVREERSLHVKALHWPKKNNRYSDIFSALAEEARRGLARRL